MGFAPSTIRLTSTAFTAGGPIPARHTGEGQDVSPPLAWSGSDKAAQAFAIVCHDPDAPLVSPNGTCGFVHWVLYNIPGSVRHLPEGVRDYTSGATDFGRSGYGGPMPPSGHGPHRYYFWVLELGEATRLEPGLSMWELLERLEPLTIGMNRLVGTYERK